MNSNATLLCGEELRLSSEQQSPSAVFYSATVVGEETRGEDIQHLLQPISCPTVYSTISNMIAHGSVYIPTHFHCLRGGEDDGMGCQ